MWESLAIAGIAGLGIGVGLVLGVAVSRGLSRRLHDDDNGQ